MKKEQVAQLRDDRNHMAEVMETLLRLIEKLTDNPPSVEEKERISGLIVRCRWMLARSNEVYGTKVTRTAQSTTQKGN